MAFLPSQLARWIERLRIALLAVACLALLPAAAQAEGWRIKKFQVVTVEPAGYTEGTSVAAEAAEAIARLARNDVLDIDGASSEFWQVVEPGPEEIDRVQFAEVLETINSTLEETAELLEREGFPSPALEPVVKLENGEEAYRVYLVRNLDGARGRYGNHNCDSLVRRERVLILNYNALLPGKSLGPERRQTVAHELFHSVQGAMPFFENCDERAIGTWIIEGTARAVGWIVAGDRDADLISESVWGLRDYSVRLPVPFDPAQKSQPEAGYRTSSFWTYLAEYQATGGQPRSPGTNPQSVKYLAHLFQASAPERDCSSPQAPCWNEVEWLDNMVRLELRSPLRALYTRFMQAYSLYGPHRQAALPQYDEDWLASSFKRTDGCRPVTLEPAGPGMQQKVRIGRFPELSALCWKLSLEGFDEETVGLGVTVEAAGGGQHPSLRSLNSAIADGAWLTAQANMDATGREQVHWDYVVETGQGTPGQLFLMTNVADQAVDTPRFGPLDVTFTVQHQYVFIRGQGTPGGGPTGADVDSPISLTGEVRSQYWGPYPMRQAKEAGIADPCMFSFGVVDAGRTSGINFNLLQNGPLATGEIPIAAYDPKEVLNQQDRILRYAGQMVVDFELGKDHPLIGDYGMAYNGRAGVLRIDSISPNWISGSAHIAGAWSGVRPSSRPHDAPPAGPRNLELSVDFSFENKPILSSLDIGACVGDSRISASSN